MAECDCSGHQVPYERRQATQALNQAMADLADRLGKPLAEMEGMLLGHAHALAEDMYPEGLPDFWRIWHDWQQVRPAPMGEL